MNEVIQEGKTREEAVEAALEKLGASEQDVEIEVIDEGSAGFLGGLLGSRNYKIKAVLKEDSAPAEDTSPPETSYEEDLDEPEPEEAPPEEPIADTEPDTEPDIEPDFSGPLPTEFFFDHDAPPEDQITGFLQTLFQHLRVKCNIDVEEGQSDIYVDISGRDSGVVIGKFGQTLDSIQYLTNVIMGKKLGNKKKIIINVGDYRSRREKSIKQLSRNVARKVIKSKKSEALAPMSPQDRRIVHLALSNFKNIKTSSEGTGCNRKVVISFKE